MNKLKILLAKWSAIQHNSEYSKREKENIEKEFQEYIETNQSISKEEFYARYTNKNINIAFIPTSNAYNTLGENITIFIQATPYGEDLLFDYFDKVKNNENPKVTFGILRTPKESDKKEFVEFNTNEIAEILAC